MPGTFRFDGRDVPFEDGDTVGSALHRAGVRAISRSMKYHRPRGLFCCTGSCASCFVRADGVPNTPACMIAARDGGRVESQNRIGSARRDLLGAIDAVTPGGLDPHDAVTRPTLANRIFLRVVRFLSGWGKAPAPGTPAPPAPRRHTVRVDEVIVGGGRLGLARARDAAAAGRRIVLVEEMERLGGSALFDPGETETLTMAKLAATWQGVEAWTHSVAFGIYDGVVAVRRGPDLWEVTAKRVTLAPGRLDGVPLFVNNDLPGILSLRGARRLWYQHGVLPGRRIAVHGAPLPERFRADLEAAGARVVVEGSLAAADGGVTVQRVRTQEGVWLRADAVVCHLPGVPRVELFQQAGCALAWDGGPAPVLAPDGATDVPSVYGQLSAFHRGPGGPEATP